MSSWIVFKVDFTKCTDLSLYLNLPAPHCIILLIFVCFGISGSYVLSSWMFFFKVDFTKCTDLPLLLPFVPSPSLNSLHHSYCFRLLEDFTEIILVKVNSFFLLLLSWTSLNVHTFPVAFTSFISAFSHLTSSVSSFSSS